MGGREGGAFQTEGAANAMSLAQEHDQPASEQEGGKQEIRSKRSWWIVHEGRKCRCREMN